MPFRSLSMLLLCLSTHIAQAEPVEVHIVSQYWQGYAEEEGKGRMWEVIRTVFASGGVTLKAETMPYERAVKAVRQGKADAWAAAYRDEKAFARFPRWPHDYEMLSVAARTETLKDWRGLESLAGKKVAHLRGYSLEQHIAVPFQSQTLNRLSQGIKLVEMGRVDYIAEAQEDLQALLQTRPPDAEPLGLRRVKELGLYLGFRPGARSEKLIALWDKHLPEAIEDGTLRAIFEKDDAMEYFPDHWGTLPEGATRMP